MAVQSTAAQRINEGKAAMSKTAATEQSVIDGSLSRTSDASLRLFADMVAPGTMGLPRLRIVAGPPAVAEAVPIVSTTVPIAVHVVREVGGAPNAALALEAQIIAALDQPARPGQPTAVAFQQKEQAIGELFAALSVAEARTLHRRLTIPQVKDPIASRFASLVPDRQARLISFLADARRRAAIAVGRAR